MRCNDERRAATAVKGAGRSCRALLLAPFTLTLLFSAAAAVAEDGTGVDDDAAPEADQIAVDQPGDQDGGTGEVFEPGEDGDPVDGGQDGSGDAYDNGNAEGDVAVDDPVPEGDGRGDSGTGDEDGDGLDMIVTVDLELIETVEMPVLLPDGTCGGCEFTTSRDLVPVEGSGRAGSGALAAEGHAVQPVFAASARSDRNTGTRDRSAADLTRRAGAECLDDLMLVQDRLCMW